MKVSPIHTDSVYSCPEPSKLVFHNQSECAYYKEIVRDGNDVPGEDKRRRSSLFLTIDPKDVKFITSRRWASPRSKGGSGKTVTMPRTCWVT